MEFLTLVLILIFVIAAVSLLSLFGKVVSLALSLIGIVFVVWLVVFGLRYLDEKNLRENLFESNTLFVLDDGKNILTGFATGGEISRDLSEIRNDFENPNSEIYDTYYKIVVVDKSSIPNETVRLVSSADPEEKEEIFKEYIDKSILSSGAGDAIDNLITAEQQEKVRVYRETLAFKHGIKEVLK